MKPGKKTKTIRRNSKNETDTSAGLRILFEDELRDIYWAEKALLKAMPKLIKESTSEELATSLSNHLTETKEQEERLERVFASLGISAVAKKCQAMAGLIEEANELLAETEKGTIRDAAIVSAGQKIEHYEIASYGILYSFAKLLGEERVASLLEKTLAEEKAADQTLAQFSDSSINVEAPSLEEVIN
jgi:ferritin-like metal-binding protein YciE